MKWFTNILAGLAAAVAIGSSIHGEHTVAIACMALCIMLLDRWNLRIGKLHITKGDDGITTGQYDECMRCSGEGQVECPRCDGDGYIECRACVGHGHVAQEAASVAGRP